jgi:endonuclease/exonuclease/phosphatase family metal-dependent hydrolase
LSKVTAGTTDLPRLAVALPGGGTIRLVNVHPHTPVSGPEDRWRMALEQLPSAGYRSYPPLITIDHVLADRRLGIAGNGVSDLPGSDHRAIHAEIVLPARAR